MNISSSPVVILGAGLAGLACALRLHKSGKPYLLLEKSDEVGGRIRTSKTNEGFLLDHGFQVLLTSYPELNFCLNLKKLELQYFNSGALIYTPQKTRLLANPFLHPCHLLNETLSNFVSLKDKALVVKLVLSLHTNAFEKQKPESALSFLKTFGFSEEFIESFWRPFCSGVFLDKNLDVDSQYFVFLLKNFSTGRVAVPKNGMQQIPIQMSEQLSNSSVRLGVDVKEIHTDAVVLADGEKIKASAVVCAYNPDVGDAVKNEYRSVVNYYFSAKKNPNWEKWLMLIPPQYGLHLNNICVMSHVSSSYSSNEDILLSASIV
ncbi:MAG: FAD-dependent oxidoreductase, partial [Pseudobdellovibrio sp.]